MKYLTITTITILILLLLNSCTKDDTVDPKPQECPEYIPPADLEPANRYFPNWEIIDTLGLRKNTKYEIYGSSNQNIWVMEKRSLYPFDEPDTVKTVMHYDGKTWTNVTKDIPASFYTSIDKIWVPDDNNVWIFGVFGSKEFAESVIYHYDGTKWEEFIDVKNGPLAANNLLPISSEEIYVTSPGYLHHWKNNKWEKYQARKIFFHSGITKADGKIFITIWDISGVDSSYIYRLDENKLVKVDSTKFWFNGSQVKFGMSLHGVGNKLYTNNMGGIYESIIKNGKPCDWERTDVSPSLGTFHNYGDGNTWLGSHYVYPYHFNGIDYTPIIPDVENYEQYLPRPASIYSNNTDVWIFDANNGYIFHGWR